MKLNKADKFVKSQVKLGRTCNAVRAAIFDKFRTWNFPPEYKDALINNFPTFENDKPIVGVDYHYDSLDEEAAYWRDDMGHVDEDAEEEKCFICRGECQCETINLELPQLPDPGTPEWDMFVDTIKVLEEHKPVILATKEIIEAQGKNFNEEFERWKKKRGIK
jgi:hypothetical protein